MKVNTAKTSVAESLGRVAAPPTGRPEDEVRLALVDRLVTVVTPEARDWVAAWREAAEEMATLVLGEASTRLLEAATVSRYPADRLATVVPDGESREILVERLSAEGFVLEQLANEPVDAVTDRRRGAALQSAWDAALAVVRAERHRWASLARSVEAWRRPWKWFVMIAAAGVVVVVVAAAWIGGWLPAPQWFDPVTRAFWSVSWP